MKPVAGRLFLLGVAVAVSLVFFLPSTPLFPAMPEWWKQHLPNKGITLGLDLQGGIHLVLEVEAERAIEIKLDRDVTTMTELFAEKKLQVESVKRTGPTEITVALSRPEAKEAVLTLTDDQFPMLSGRSSGDRTLVLALKPDEAERIKKRAVLTGDVLTDARVAIGQFQEAYVSVTFDSTGAKLFERITAENVKKRMAIILDNTVYSAPVIQERIGGGRAQITGSFSTEEANDLAIILRAGALPAPVKIIQDLTVGPSLGRDSIEKGVRSTVIAGALVILFMVVYYRLSGAIADLALMLNLVCLVGALAGLNATLTLPGIAGIILTIGMGVDSNVLILERIREELRPGNAVRPAVDAGYDKAFLTIVDSHVTTLITGFALFLFGTGPIKGFAVTLCLGIAINLFTALVGTKVIYDLLNRRGRMERLSI